jgi:hypothetical protein
MEPITKTKLESDWIEKENNEFMQGRHRRYLHFDKTVNLITEEIANKVLDEKFVKGYNFFPLIRRVSKNRLYKKNTAGKKVIVPKERPICYAAHFDALIYSWYAYQLNSCYENIINKEAVDKSIIAYRKLEKSNLDFSKEVFDFISNREDCVAVAFDIKGFYDNLDFSLLKKAWANTLSRADLPENHYAVYKAITRFSFVDFEKIVKVLGFKEKNPKFDKLSPLFNSDLMKLIRDKGLISTNQKQGVPQGAPISCVLSNMYMLEFDRKVLKKVEEIGGLYRRYSDDIIVVCSSDKLKEVRDFITTEIKVIKLIIEDSKTEVRFFKKEGLSVVCRDEAGKLSKLQYLGVNFDGSNLSLRHKGYAKFERRMTKAIKKEVAKARKGKRSISKKGLYERFTPFGEKNYITYVKRASETFGVNNILKPVKAGRLFKKIKERVIKFTTT